MSGNYPTQKFQEISHPLDLRFTVGYAKQRAT